MFYFISIFILVVLSLIINWIFVMVIYLNLYLYY